MERRRDSLSVTEGVVIVSIDRFCPAERSKTASSMGVSGRRAASPRSPMAQQRRQNFLPLPTAPSFLAGQESHSFAALRAGVNTLFIEPGSPWENGYIELFNARLRDELLNGEIFYTLDEVRAVTGWWRDHYNKLRPHSALGYHPPTPEAIMPS
jgi:hypothetical protein